MARYEHLPIYKTAYDLLLALLNLTKTFPRDFRYTLGEHLHNSAINVLKLVYTVNSAKNKTDALKDLLSAIQEIGVLIRVCRDLKIIGEDKFLFLIEIRDSLEKQSNGWLKSFENNAGMMLSS